jgi:hypothetical protein
MCDCKVCSDDRAFILKALKRLSSERLAELIGASNQADISPADYTSEPPILRDRYGSDEAWSIAVLDRAGLKERDEHG